VVAVKIKRERKTEREIERVPEQLYAGERMDSGVA